VWFEAVKYECLFWAELLIVIDDSIINNKLYLELEACKYLNLN